MSVARKRTFSLPNAQSEYIDQLVASGSYASGSEVVRAGLRALQERDEAVERWLRDEVATTYDRMQTDPGRAISLEEAFDAVQARRCEATKMSA
jgi:antitoxin ParD1/3/4